MRSQGPSRSSRVLSGLSSAQREVVESRSLPLCVLAGPGSGKTSVLTRHLARRLLDGSIAADHVLALTFTRKAAAQLRSRLSDLQASEAPWAATFHSAAYRLLARDAHDRGRDEPAVITDPLRLVAPLVANQVGPQKGQRAGPAIFVAGEIHWAAVRGLGPDDYGLRASEAGRPSTIDHEQVANVYRRYLHEKRKRGVLDLDDLLWEATRLCSSPDMAPRIGWTVRHLYVDEFQDVDPAQWALVRALLQGRPDLFVVGDPDQAIYSFNGSDPSLLTRLPDLVPGITVMHLEQNHRCTASIVATARRALAPERQSASGQSASGQSASGDSTAEDPTDEDGPLPLVVSFDSRQQEATALCRWLRSRWGEERSWSQSAVLARTHRRLEPIAIALRGEGIPVCLRAKRHDPSLRDAIARLSCRPPREALRSALEDEPGLVEVLEPYVEEYSMDEPVPLVGAFVRWLDTTSQDDLTADGPGVLLSTFHGAKGLEWQSVAVIGLEAGMVPIAYASSREEILEEQRLLYVALTRARRNLWLSWSRAYGADGRDDQHEPLPFLEPSPLLAPIERFLREEEHARDGAVDLERVHLLRDTLSRAV